MTKANKTVTLFKSDAHIRISFTMSVEQQAGLLLCIYAGAADTSCLCSSHSSVKTQMEQGAKNALSLAIVGGSQNISAWSF